MDLEIKQQESEEKENRIVIEEIDPEEINKLWDSLPELKASL